MEISNFRIARPTTQMEKIKTFYHEGLGLEIVGSFKNHEGYDGIMFGVPDKKYHLEFTCHKNDDPSILITPPSKDNLLVFYLPDQEKWNQIVKRLNHLGYYPKESENPYWNPPKGLTFEDPDLWRIVLVNGTY
ncbi:unnamed protein product [Cunninghamella blakesleeana]